MTYKFTEESFENPIIELFQQDLAYQFQPGAQIDYRQVLLIPYLQTAIQKLTPTAHPLALQEALRLLTAFDAPNFLEDNHTFHQYLTQGIAVNYYHNGPKSDYITLIDFAYPYRYHFLLVNQFIIQGIATKSPNLIIFVNGLPPHRHRAQIRLSQIP